MSVHCPFDLIHVRWPRPTMVEAEQWLAEPEWSVPCMPTLPECLLEWSNDQWRWTIDWSRFLHATIRMDEMSSTQERDLEGFCMVWQLQIKTSTTMMFSGNACHIRRAGQTLYRQPSIGYTDSVQLTVHAGEILDIAQVLTPESLRWWAYSLDEQAIDPLVVFQPYLERVCASLKLEQHNGPALKLYNDGETILQLALAVYSLILNGGYIPEQILLFGEHLWSTNTHTLVQLLLPFVTIVETSNVIAYLQESGGDDLITLIKRYDEAWKLACCLLYSPTEFCFLDHDVLILDSLQHALTRFQDRDYLCIPLPTRRANIGLYWWRASNSVQKRIQHMLSTPPPLWNKGFLHALFTATQLSYLPEQRYFAIATHVLPGGIIGYDYRNNPCGFTCLALCGLAIPDKPSYGRTFLLLDRLFSHTAS